MYNWVMSKVEDVPRVDESNDDDADAVEESLLTNVRANIVSRIIRDLIKDQKDGAGFTS